VLKRAEWILKQQAADRARPPPRRFVGGESVPYRGRDVPIAVERSDVKEVTLRFNRWTFEIGVPPAISEADRRDQIVQLLERWFRARAEERIVARVEHWSSVIGHHPRQVLIRNQRRRWGSCGGDGTLRLNWRLILAPPALLDYVVVHELAHLAVRDHSAAFWSEVARVMPDHRERRSALRALGPSLTL